MNELPLITENDEIPIEMLDEFENGKGQDSEEGENN